MQQLVRILALTLVVSTLAGCLSDGGDGNETTGGDDGDGFTPILERNVTWGDVATATIRPGASFAGSCTFNFLFTDDNGSAYIGTAAHCTDPGDRVKVGAGDEFGTVVYDSDDANGADTAVDFSLILIDEGQVENAHPQMLGYDAPKGTIEAGEAEAGDQLAIYGYGIVLGEDERTRPRFGVLVDEDGQTYRADMPAVNGDSGSPIIHVPTGKAFGIISHYGTGAVPPSTDEGPILPFILNELAKAGFVVELATA